VPEGTPLTSTPLPAPPVPPALPAPAVVPAPPLLPSTSGPSPSAGPSPADRAGPPGLARPSLRKVALGFYGIVTLFALGYALFSGEVGRLFGEKPPTLVGVLGAAGLALGLVALWRTGIRLWKPVAAATDELERMIGPLSVGDAILLAVISGFAEELLFRGALWPPLGLVGSALLFGLVHVLPRRALWVYPVFALVAGFLLGLLREGTESVIPPMLCHVLVNAINLAWIGGRARKAFPPPVASA
jgi:membrane protease YdiL (CAAX protease family)